MLSITPASYHGISLPTPAPLCLLLPEHRSARPSRCPSCLSWGLVAEQPLGKEAAGRNTLTWWQLCCSKDAFHLPMCNVKVGLSYPGNLDRAQNHLVCC